MFVYLFPQNIHSPLAEQLPKLPLPLDITTLLFVFSFILNQNQENQKNPTVKAKKVPLKMAFKSYSFYLKKIKKADLLCMTFCSTADTSVQQVLQLSISKSVFIYSAPRSHFFQRISQPPSQDQTNSNWK